MVAEHESDSRHRYSRALWALGFALGFSAAFGVVITLVDAFFGGTWEERAQQGDFWGGHLAAFASIVTTVLLVVTLLLQKEELELQRKELRAAVSEMELAREVNAQQEVQLREQVRIADRTSTINGFMELVNRRNELRRIFRDRLNKANTPDQSQRKAKQTEIRENWRPRIEAVNRLLIAMASRDCISSEEKEALLAIAKLKDDES